jgi:tetratricopeptide (TPR) repeat protein
MRTWLLAIFIAVAFPLLATAADAWVGQKVFWKDGAKAKVGNQEIDIQKVPFPAIVENVDGDWLWLGRAWVRKTDVMLTQQALDEYNDRIRRNPKVAESFRVRASIWKSNGDLDNALKDCNEAIRLDPKSATGYGQRGDVYYAQGEFDPAIADYSEAIRLDPARVTLWASRGAAWYRQGSPAKAVEDLSQAIQLDPSDISSYINRGSAYLNQGQVDKALEDYESALRIDPKYPPAFHGRALVWERKHEYDKALADFAAILRLNPQDLGGLNGLAWLLATCSDAKVRDGAQAVRSATTLCELSNWKDPNSLDTLAVACAEAGDFASATKWEKQAIELADKTQIKELTDRLELFQSGKPFHEPAM